MFKQYSSAPILRALVALLLFSAPLSAQGPLSGRVTDQTGRALRGAIITVEGTNLGALTDGNGQFIIAAAPAPPFMLVIDNLGYAPQRVRVNALGSALLIRLSESALKVDAMVVTATGTAQRQMESSVAIGSITGPELRLAKPSHPAELISRVAGALVTVAGSGEGHMTSIRQPITTNPVYLFLEDGVPTRSTGFFNHNGLYEVNIPQASRIEVLKGPGTALYGSDAIGGVINVETRAPFIEPAVEFYGEAGGHGWQRALLSAGGTSGANGLRADLNLTRWSGWRDATAYDRQSATVRWDRQTARGRLKTVAAWSSIDQIDPSPLTRSDFEQRPALNEFPIATRGVQAFRISSSYQRADSSSGFSITPFARWNELAIVPSWMLSFDPVRYTTGHKSIGVVARAQRSLPSLRAQLTGGLDVDYSPGFRQERIVQPTRSGQIFTTVRDSSIIYDYDVTFHGVSPYLQAEFTPVARLHLTAGLRYDQVGFDYDNKLSALATGRWRRPADTNVSYHQLSPKLGFSYEVAPGLALFGSYRHSFRAPSEGQLFRQGSALSTVDLKPIRADQTELGLRGVWGARFDYEVSGYDLRVEDDVLTYIRPDNQRETQNAGATQHRGVEASAGVNGAKWLRLDAAYTRTWQRYRSWQPRSTISYDGNTIERAPDYVINTRALLTPARLSGAQLGLEWQRVGGYWQDPENTHRYEGHGLWNVRASAPVWRGFDLIARVINLADARYSETSSFTTFEQERLTPGAPRMFYLGLQGSTSRGVR